MATNKEKSRVKSSRMDMFLFVLVEKIRITIKGFAKLPCGPVTNLIVITFLLLGSIVYGVDFFLWCMTFENH